MAVIGLFASRPWRRAWTWVPVIWIVVGLAVFSHLERVKPVYVLYVFGAVALLMALCIAPHPGTRVRRVLLGLAVAVGLVTAVASVGSTSFVERRFYDEALGAVDADWTRAETPTVAVLYGFHPDVTLFNAMVVAAANAQGGHAPKTLYTPPDPVAPGELTPDGYRGAEDTASFDYAIVPYPDGQPPPVDEPSWEPIKQVRFKAGRSAVTSVVDVYRVGVGSGS